MDFNLQLEESIIGMVKDSLNIDFESWDEDEKQKLITQVVEKFEFVRGEMSELHSTWDDIRDAYRCEKEFSTPRGITKPKINIKTPLTLRHVETKVAMSAINIINPKLNFIKVTDSNTNVRQYKIENLLFQKCFVGADYGYTIARAIKSAILYGRGIIKVIPNRQTGVPNIMWINPRDFMIDPFATNVNDAQFIVHRMWLGYDEIKAKTDAGIYDKKEGERLLKDHYRHMFGKEELDLDKDKLTDTFKSLFYEEEYRDDMRDSISSEWSEEKFGRVCVKEYYDNNFIVTVADDDYLLKVQPNFIGYPFFTIQVNLPVDDEFWLKSIGELLLDRQNEADVKRNQRADNINKILNTPFMIQKGAIDKTSDLIVAGNRKIIVNNPDGIRPLAVPDVTQKANEEISYLEKEAADISSASSLIQGGAAKNERMTTSETNKMYGQATMKFDFELDIIVSIGIIPLLKYVLLMMSITSPGPMFASNNAAGVGAMEPVMTQEMVKEYSITLQINPNKTMIDQQTAVQMYQLLSQDPFVDQAVMRKHVIPLMLPHYPEEMLRDMAVNEAKPENVQLSKNSAQRVE